MTTSCGPWWSASRHAAGPAAKPSTIGRSATPVFVSVRAGPRTTTRSARSFAPTAPSVSRPVSPGLPNGPSGQIRIARPSGDGFVLETAPVGTLDRARLTEALAREA